MASPQTGCQRLQFFRSSRSLTTEYGTPPAGSRLEQQNPPQTTGDVRVRLGYIFCVAASRGVHIGPLGVPQVSSPPRFHCPLGRRSRGQGRCLTWYSASQLLNAMTERAHRERDSRQYERPMRSPRGWGGGCINVVQRPFTLSSMREI